MMDRDVDMRAPSSQEFVDGSVVRVRLHNFLTYAEAEFFPGPRLNMLLGTNGSGKSSIVCALCIGLAGSTKLLGRADMVGQFVRLEKESGYSEIELFFEKGNRVIHRQIFLDHTSVWKLDGRPSTLQRVRAVLEAARIQIDNLCQFLPQDKVGEFSHLNSVQLLRATEKAALNGELATTHEQLVVMRSNVVDEEQRIHAARASLQLKKTENQSREEEVARIRRYEALQAETDLMEKKVLWLEYEELRSEFDKLKAEKEAREAEFNIAREHAVAPLDAQLKIQNRALKEANQATPGMKRKMEETYKHIESKKQKVEALFDAVNQTAFDITQLRGHHAKLRQRLERLEGELGKWKDEQNAMSGVSQLQRERTSLEQQQRDSERNRAAVSSQHEAARRAMSSSQQELCRADSKLRALMDETTQRREALRRSDPHAIRAAEWVARNQNRFRRKVWGPVALELHVRETLHAKYVEAVLPNWLLGALVVECKDDYDVLLHEMNAMGLKVSVVTVHDGIRKPVTRLFSPAQMARLREQYGITGYLEELVTAPDVIHEAIRPQGVHNELVGTMDTEDQVNQGRDNVFSALSSGDRRSAFLTPAKRYLTTISKYGARNPTTRTMELPNPRLLAASSTNEEEKNQLTRGMDQAKVHIASRQKEIEKLKAEEREFDKAKNGLTLRVREIRDKLAARDRLDDKVDEGEEKAASLRHEMAEDKTQHELAKVVELRRQIAAHTVGLRQCLVLQNACIEVTIEDMVLKGQIAEADAQVAHGTKRLKAAEAAVREFKQQYDDAKKRAVAMARRTKAAKVKAQAAASWEANEEAFAELSNDLDELRGVIDTNDAMLASFRVDRSIVDRYRRVCQEIQDEEAALVALEAAAQTSEDDFKKIKDAYHTKLHGVVQQIDASFKDAFQQIGCIGEVALVAQDKDVAKWGIERRVQFREHGKLTTMTASTQSGGEKSVATIMYLMALQSLTECPFRVVDEINQGMDEYNERKVMHRLTALACGQRLPQYFVVTPKLISGITYHRDTTVHFILNGPHNNLRQDQWDVRRILDAGLSSE